MSTRLRKDACVVFFPHFPKHKHTHDTNTHTHSNTLSYTLIHSLTPDSSDLHSARFGKEN